MTNLPQDEPLFQISVVSKIIGIHQQTIRSYERMGFVRPARSNGNTRLFSSRDIDQIGQIVSWISDLGLNLAGVEVMLRMQTQINDLETKTRSLEEENARLRQQIDPPNSHRMDNDDDQEFGANFLKRFQ
ncbi:MAG: MerR family transcriptional regulator [Chloroflexi bacterium]|nr:MerR family transcriptional regulator [Chloroflexota bacterium]|tara:strand:+ start:288 stop:677 length:390 start_codon:yes stop_codon:yes gene_type:complete